MQKVIEKAVIEQRKLLEKKLKVIKRHKKAIDLSDTIADKKL